MKQASSILAKVLVLFCLVAASSAFAGYSYRGVCYSTTDDAISAFAVDKSGLDIQYSVNSSSSTPYTFWQIYKNCYSTRGSLYVYCSVTTKSSLSATAQPGTFTSTAGIPQAFTGPLFPACDVPSTINSTDILYVYSWGVGAVLSLWALGFAVAAGRRVIAHA